MIKSSLGPAGESIATTLDTIEAVAPGLYEMRITGTEGTGLNTGFQVEFVLKGLGSAGQDTERTLRRAILGYYREDLSLVPPPSTRGGGDLPSPDAIP